MRVIFDPESENWDLLINQSGSGDFFVGLPYQRGYGQKGTGVGGLFKSLIKYLIPLGKRIGPVIAREGLDTLGRMLDNNDNSDLKTNVLNETKKGLRNLVNKAVTNTQAGSGKKRRKKSVSKKKIAFCKAPPRKRSFDVLPGSKRQRFDALGSY